MHLSEFQTSDFGNIMEFFTPEGINKFLDGYSKRKIRKCNLTSFKLLHAMFSIMRKEKAQKIVITDTQDEIELNPSAIAMAFFYEEGLANNLKSRELVLFVQNKTISFFEKLKTMRLGIQKHRLENERH